jgi:non-canonical (house-cleaning) NTP pyrophosphatase
MMHNIAVASLNYSKIGAVEDFFNNKFPLGVQVSGFDVASIVKPIPTSADEGIKGVNHRLNEIDDSFDMKIAFEGTFMHFVGKYWMQNIVAVEWIDVNPKRFIGGGFMFMIPPSAYKVAEAGYKFHNTIITLENAWGESQEFIENLTIAGVLTNRAINRIRSNITALEDAWRQIENMQSEPKIANNIRIDENSPLFCREKYNLLESECAQLFMQLNTYQAI